MSDSFSERHITVIGSSTLRVEPDLAILGFSISSDAKHLKDALSEVQKVSAKIQSYLTSAGITHVGISPVYLSPNAGIKSRSRSDGGHATYQFQVVLNDLNRYETVLLGLIDAGVKQLQSVKFQTSKLDEIRILTRQQAIQAAKNKAFIYCEAANVQLGDVISIDDQNQDQLQKVDAAHQDADESPHSLNPASIVVSATVKVVFEINLSE